MKYISREMVDRDLSPSLRQYAVTVVFVKKDDTVRAIHCTLKPELLPVRSAEETASTKKSNPDIQLVYDLTTKAWRSFDKNRVSSYIVVDNPTSTENI